MTTDLRALLTEVAAGRLDPSRAVEMIDELPAEPAAEPADPIPARPAAAPRPEGIERVRVTGSTRPVRIIGDHSVATVTVDGPNSVVRDGNTLRVEAGAAAGAVPGQPGAYAYEHRSGLSRWLSAAGTVGVPLTVRMNPALLVDVEVMAGSLEVVGMAGHVTFSLTAGSLRLHDCTGTVNGVVRAGSAVLQVRPTAGASVVRVESGSVDLRLLPGSDVLVSGRADLGEFKVRGADGALKVQKTDRLTDIVLGSGTATFDIQIAMGSAKVRLP
jgi:hypothetical protein